MVKPATLDGYSDQYAVECERARRQAQGGHRRLAGNPAQPLYE